MSLESPNIPNEVSESSGSADFPVRGWWRVLYILFLIVVPVFSFVAVEAIKPEWQSGDREAYVALLMLPEAAVFFLTLIAYSVLCYLLLLLNADHFAKFFAVRLGIYTGVFLALQYTILLGVYLFSGVQSLAILLVWFLPLYLPKLKRLNFVKRILSYIRLWMIAVVLIVYVIIASFIREDSFIPVLLVFLGIVASGPFWSFLIAIRASAWLLEYHETNLTLPHGLGIAAWLAAYVSAWRFDILKMHELYAQLPPVPPDCYIATAAAQGHPRFVGSHLVHRADGLSLRVNGQLQHLKCVELALLAVSPRMHRVLRKIYDVVGRSLAQRMTNPFLADVAYLLLKPAEWFAIIVLKWIVPEIESISRRMYIGQ